MASHGKVCKAQPNVVGVHNHSHSTVPEVWTSLAHTNIEMAEPDDWTTQKVATASSGPHLARSMIKIRF
eukprot:2599230-Amphidinium_carterae.1